MTSLESWGDRKHSVLRSPCGRQVLVKNTFLDSDAEELPSLLLRAKSCPDLGDAPLPDCKQGAKLQLSAELQKGEAIMEATKSESGTSTPKTKVISSDGDDTSYTWSPSTSNGSPKLYQDSCIKWSPALDFPAPPGPFQSPSSRDTPQTSGGRVGVLSSFLNVAGGRLQELRRRGQETLDKVGFGESDVAEVEPSVGEELPKDVVVGPRKVGALKYQWRSC
eukprot:TRINITY_DN8599_c0_g1_i2.p1 TRINITY_DN8599_c0_g1~~TRINITY_DN8599_c0_g1_i2.p1  ORF type:complete len:221 (+),score=47.51 TRINITY_DN8599_c0_g1_i2:112-774(+)